jgi:hypothetical protein
MDMGRGSRRGFDGPGDAAIAAAPVQGRADDSRSGRLSKGPRAGPARMAIARNPRPVPAIRSSPAPAGTSPEEDAMADRDARVRDLQQQLHQLDMEARGSALTPGEAQRNREQREALTGELRGLEGAVEPPAVKPVTDP